MLVNTARGAIVDEEALAEALEEGRLLAPGPDVYDGEPASAAPARGAAAPFLLPHVGSAPPTRRGGDASLAAEKAAAFRGGRP